MEVGPGTGPRRAKPRFGWMLAVVASLALATATAFAGGFGSRLADLVASSKGPLLSYSVSQLSGECNGGTFLPDSSAREILRQGPPADWSTIEAQPGSAAADRDPVEVSIQGESARAITLTGIAFQVKRRPQPPGATFGGPCGGPVVGRALEVDLDSTPPRIVASSSEQSGMLGSTGDGRRLARPIRFPWTVSVTDPLLLDIIASTDSCYCSWSAQIPWISGDEKGVIEINRDGNAFRVAATEDLTGYTSYEDGWRSYPPGP